MTEASQLEERIRARVNELPVLPTVVGQLMTLDREADDYFDRLLELIESDPTFAARVLAGANAATSSPTDPITSVRAALTRLGSAGASSMILALAVSRVFVPRDPWEKSLWRHALQVASASRLIATHATTDVELSSDEAFTAGLLHDIGRMVMFLEAPDVLRRVDEGTWDSPRELIDMEISICGVAHTDIGSIACEHWGLPEILRLTVLGHHDPHRDVTVGKVEALVSTIHFADLAMFPAARPGTMGWESASKEEIAKSLIPMVPEGVTLTPTTLQHIIGTATAEVEATCRALGIG